MITTLTISLDTTKDDLTKIILKRAPNKATTVNVTYPTGVSKCIEKKKFIDYHEGVEASIEIGLMDGKKFKSIGWREDESSGQTKDGYPDCDSKAYKVWRTADRLCDKTTHKKLRLPPLEAVIQACAAISIKKVFTRAEFRKWEAFKRNDIKTNNPEKLMKTNKLASKQVSKKKPAKKTVAKKAAKKKAPAKKKATKGGRPLGSLSEKTKAEIAKVDKEAAKKLATKKPAKKKAVTPAAPAKRRGKPPKNAPRVIGDTPKGSETYYKPTANTFIV